MTQPARANEWDTTVGTVAMTSPAMLQCAGCKRVRKETEKWYGGRKGSDRYCTAAACKVAARKAAAEAAVPETVESSASSRKRPADDDEPQDSSVVAPPARITEVLTVLGIRCASSLEHALARSSAMMVCLAYCRHSAVY